MPAERLIWYAALAATPGAAAFAYLLGLRGRRLYSMATACASMLVMVAAVPLLMFLGGRDLEAEHISTLSAVLVPFAALLWLIAVVVTPSGRRSEAGVARSATACILHMAAFLTVEPVPLVLIWIATSLTFTIGHLEPRFAGARRIAVAHLGLSTLFLTAGVVLANRTFGPDAVWEQWGISLILVAVKIGRAHV